MTVAFSETPRKRVDFVSSKKKSWSHHRGNVERQTKSLVRKEIIVWKWKHTRKASFWRGKPHISLDIVWIPRDSQWCFPSSWRQDTWFRSSCITSKFLPHKLRRCKKACHSSEKFLFQLQDKSTERKGNAQSSFCSSHHGSCISWWYHFSRWLVAGRSQTFACSLIRCKLLAKLKSANVTFSPTSCVWFSRWSFTRFSMFSKVAVKMGSFPSLFPSPCLLATNATAMWNGMSTWKWIQYNHESTCASSAFEVPNSDADDEAQLRPMYKSALWSVERATLPWQSTHWHFSLRVGGKFELASNAALAKWAWFTVFLTKDNPAKRHATRI